MLYLRRCFSIHESLSIELAYKVICLLADQVVTSSPLCRRIQDATLDAGALFDSAATQFVAYITPINICYAKDLLIGAADAISESQQPPRHTPQLFVFVGGIFREKPRRLIFPPLSPSSEAMFSSAHCASIATSQRSLPRYKV